MSESAWFYSFLAVSLLLPLRPVSPSSSSSAFSSVSHPLCTRRHLRGYLCLGRYRRAGSRLGQTALRLRALLRIARVRACARACEAKRYNDERNGDGGGGGGGREKRWQKGSAFPPRARGDTRMTRRWELFLTTEVNRHIASAGLVLTPRHAARRPSAREKCIDL